MLKAVEERGISATITLPVDLDRRLVEIARTQGTSRSAVVRDLIERALREDATKEKRR